MKAQQHILARNGKGKTSVTNSQNTTAQIMMTLAQLAATSPNERPAGETVAQQQTRIFNAINSQLSNPNLITNAQWQAVWVGLTQDRANLAFIAQNTSTNSFAVSLRGTQFNSLIDLAEDLDVASAVEFTAGPAYIKPVLISQGAMEAFTEITAATYTNSENVTANLFQALTTLIAAAPANPTLYITGHSLGGAMATVIALYLAAQTWQTNTPAFAVYTFAAPTAGLQAFADCYDHTFPNSWRYYNVWDLVPTAWVNSSLSNAQATFYPSQVSASGPGPAQTLTVHGLIGQFMNAPGANTYVQTNKNSSVKLNNQSSYGTAGTYDPSHVNPTLEDFLAQVSFQHNNYMSFLGLQPSQLIPSLAPVVAAIDATTIVPITPNNGSASGNVTVTITGANFTPDCFVDFGTIAAASVTYVSSTQLTAVSPALVGTVHVRVTNNFGTSAATPADEFTAPPPSLAPSITAITPTSGPASAGYTVTLTGVGFTSDCTVSFGKDQVDPQQVTIVSLAEIVVTSPVIALTPPMKDSAAASQSQSVSVTVTNSNGTSQPQAFNFGPPVVTSISPSFGLLGKKADNPQVTITGVGFGSSQGSGSVEFGGTPAPSIASWSDTEIMATPPNVQGTKNTPVNVTVTNSTGLISIAFAANEYIYYNGAELKG